MSYYGTVSDGDAYFATRLDSEDWEEAESTDKLKAIGTATRWIDRLSYNGDKTDADQLLEFPRGGDTDVPTDIEYATYELAIALLQGIDPEQEISKVNTVASNYGAAKNAVDTHIVPVHVRAGIPSALAWGFLSPYLRDMRTIKLTKV